MLSSQLLILVYTDICTTCVHFTACMYRANICMLQFACGSSVVKDASQREQIDVQGDYIEDMPAFLLKTYASELTAATIVLVEDKQRRVFSR